MPLVPKSISRNFTRFIVRHWKTRRATPRRSASAVQPRMQGCERKSRPQAHQHEFCRTAELERPHQMRRYTRLSNGFSRKLENHAAATALNYFAYNFIKIHRTLRTSPAMAAGVTGRLW